MLQFFSLILFFLGAVLSSDVIDLNDGNFNDIIKGKDIVLIEFFAPWCGHCKKLIPEYETAATALLKNDPPVILAKIDCVGDGKDSCSKHGVSGYPTLKIFRNGVFSQEYDGPRDAQGIIGHMRKNSGPSSVELKDYDHLQSKLSNAEEIVVVGFFSSAGAFKERFLSSADLKRDKYSFAHTLDSDIMEKEGHKDAIVLYHPKHMHCKFEDKKAILEDASATTNDISEFIKKNQVGLVSQVKPDHENLFKKPFIIVYYKVDWKLNLKGTRYWRNRVARVAKKFVGDMTFTIAAKSDYQTKMSDWGWNANDDQLHVVAFREPKDIFIMTDEFSVDNLEKFATQFKNGELKPYLKSEPIPESNDEPVKVVVGETFNQIVNDPSKDVLIEFYAPWCGHCKSLEPIYTDLAEQLKDVKDVVIAKIDATANTVPPEFQVSGFPTIYWAPMAGKATPKKYEGAREVSNFLEFVKKEATNPVVLSEKKSKKDETKEDL